MRINDKRIIKHTVPVTTALGCYGDDMWVIPLQDKNEPAPEISDNGLVDNHGHAYVLIFHADDGLLEKQDQKRNEWRVTVERMDDENGLETFANGSFKTAHAAVNSRIVEDAIAGRLVCT